MHSVEDSQLFLFPPYSSVSWVTFPLLPKKILSESFQWSLTHIYPLRILYRYLFERTIRNTMQRNPVEFNQILRSVLKSSAPLQSLPEMGYEDLEDILDRVIPEILSVLPRIYAESCLPQEHLMRALIAVPFRTSEGNPFLFTIRISPTTTTKLNQAFKLEIDVASSKEILDILHIRD